MTVDKDRITILFPSIGAIFEGAVIGGDALDGTFTQQGRPFPLKLTRGTPPPVAPSPIADGSLTQEKLEALRQTLGSPAMGTGWQRGSGQPMIMVAGLRSADATIPVAVGDSWHLGLITKSMTAVIAARAVEAGLLGWDSTIASVLGPSIANLHPDFAAVTLMHLLNHRSGLPTSAGEAALADYSALPGPDIHTERLRFVQSALSVAPATPPGSAYAYANAGFVTVGAMLEKLAGKPWEALIQEQLFKPLGLKSAGIGLPGTEGKIDQPLGHVIGKEGKRIAHFTDLPAVLGPAGLTHMNFADLLTYLAAHRDRAPGLLRSESWEKLHTAHFGGNYAAGWIVNGDTRFHNGSNLSWYAIVTFNPVTSTVNAFASNDIAAMGETENIMRALGRSALAESG